jgi:serpin B
MTLPFRGTASVLVAGSILLSGCDLITGPGEQEASWTRIALDERVTDAYAGFGFELFRALQAEDPTGNVFISPTSAAFALTMTYNGARGTTADQMAQALGVAHLDRDELNATNGTWLDALRDVGDPRADLAVANSIWHHDALPMPDSFLDRVRTSYDANVAPITTAAAINTWVAHATHGNIPEIVGSVPANVVAYLISAVYFKADWTYSFDASKTRPAAFHRLDGSSVDVPMMEQRGRFGVRSDASVHILRLPYGAGRFSMVLALPQGGTDLGMLAEQLDAERWRAWMSEFHEVDRVAVRLPRFEVAWESSLVDVLRVLGMEAAFEPEQADLSAMFDGGGPWIGEVLQKTFLSVDEEGTTAAAVTSVSAYTSAPPSFTFDRPFFMALYDHATETVLFLGQITDPTG